jgi:hypothetical protein
VVSAIEALQARLDSLESDYKGKCAELELFHDSHDAALAKLAALEGQLAQAEERKLYWAGLYDKERSLAAGAQPSEAPKTYMQGYSDGKQWALEAAAQVADDSDHRVDGRGYYDQLGDANETQHNIVEAIRNMAKEIV